MSTRRRFLAAGGLLSVVAGALLVEAWWPAARESLSADIRDGGSGVEAEVRLTQPDWLRPERAGEVVLEVARLGSDASGPSTPQALVARLSGMGADVSPGDEQAAPWRAADRWAFTWRVSAAATLDPTAALSLSLRDYAQSAPTETVLWARLVHFQVRPPLLAPGASLTVLAFGVTLTVLALGRSR